MKLFWRVFPFYIGLGMLISFPYLQKRTQASNTRQRARSAAIRLTSATPVGMVAPISGEPREVILPRLNIDLNIVQGAYLQAASKWTVSNNRANYAFNSTEPNTTSNKTLIYGHATDQVFGRTVGLQPGDIAYVVTDNGHTFEYVFTSKVVVSPTDVAIFKSLDGRPGLVLMSCDGFYSQARRLMYFDLKQAK